MEAAQRCAHAGCDATPVSSIIAGPVKEPRERYDVCEKHGNELLAAPAEKYREYPLPSDRAEYTYTPDYGRYITPVQSWGTPSLLFSANDGVHEGDPWLAFCPVLGVSNEEFESATRVAP